jgi:hypothetical protein
MTKEVEFTADCEIFKKGEKKTFSADIANALVNQEKVAKFTEVKEAKKPKDDKKGEDKA